MTFLCLKKDVRKNEKGRKKEKAMEQDRVRIVDIAEELGLLDRVLEDGWKTLSAKETGRIGGLVTRRKREESSR